VGRIGLSLGARKLRPKPKVGTSTDNVADAVKAAKAGQVQFRVERAGVIHAGIGKASFESGKLVENIRAFVSALVRAKPQAAKGTYFRKIALSSSMGPGVTVDVADALGS